MLRLVLTAIGPSAVCVLFPLDPCRKGSPSLFDGAGFVPRFANNFDARLARGSRPATGSDENEHWLWVKHQGCDDAGRLAECHADVALLAVADMAPPAMLAKFETAAPVSSATWMVNFLEDAEARSAATNGWWLLRTSAEHAKHGYSSQDMAVYGKGGVPVIVGRQSVAIFA